jgi:septin family protein
MRIIEKGCDPSIKLAKFKFNCDECDKSIPNPLPQNLNHFMMIVGKPGSSKTTLIMNMICKRGEMYKAAGELDYIADEDDFLFVDLDLPATAEVQEDDSIF